MYDPSACKIKTVKSIMCLDFLYVKANWADGHMQTKQSNTDDWLMCNIKPDFDLEFDLYNKGHTSITAESMVRQLYVCVRGFRPSSYGAHLYLK